MRVIPCKQKASTFFSQIFSQKPPFGGPWGSILAPSGSIWRPSGLTWVTLGAQVSKSQIWEPFCRQKVVHFGSILGTKTLKLEQKCQKVGTPEATPKKCATGGGPEPGQYGSRTVTSMVLVRSQRVQFCHFWAPFGYLLGSLLVTFAPKCRILGLKRGPKNEVKKKCRKGHAKSLEIMQNHAGLRVVVP